MLRGAERLFREDKRAETALSPRDDARPRGIILHLVARFDFAMRDSLDIFERQRRRQKDPCRSGAAGDFADRQIGFAREQIMWLKRGRTAVGHQKFTRL